MDIKDKTTAERVRRAPFILLNTNPHHYLDYRIIHGIRPATASEEKNGYKSMVFSAGEEMAFRTFHTPDEVLELIELAKAKHGEGG